MSDADCDRDADTEEYDCQPIVTDSVQPPVIRGDRNHEKCSTCGHLWSQHDNHYGCSGENCNCMRMPR